MLRELAGMFVAPEEDTQASPPPLPTIFRERWSSDGTNVQRDHSTNIFYVLHKCNSCNEQFVIKMFGLSDNDNKIYRLAYIGSTDRNACPKCGGDLIERI